MSEVVNKVSIMVNRYNRVSVRIFTEDGGFYNEFFKSVPPAIDRIEELIQKLWNEKRNENGDWHDED